MLDDLRNSASSSFEEKPPEQKPAAPRKAHETLFLGMTAAQRFVVALLLFLAVLVIGALLLVVADKVSVNLPALLGF
jgi:hypothetical protein